jgi:hypothetical protein
VRIAALTLLGTTILVPDDLVVPYGPHSLFVGRLILWATCLGMIMRVSDGEIRSSSLRPGRVHLVLAGFVLVAYVVGVTWAPWPASPKESFERWLGLFDQLLFLWCAVAFVRVLGVRWVATRLVALVAISASIGVAERFDHHSYARWWFEHSIRLSQSSAGPLEHRGHSSRVRAAAEFALEFGWVTTTMIPLACAVALQTKRRLAMVVPPLLAAAVVFSVSRSALGGMAVGALAFIVLNRFERRSVLLVVLGAALAACLYFAFPTIHGEFAAANPDSANSRTRRAQLAGSSVLQHPATGLGLGGVQALGLQGFDSSYVLFYATLGVVGVVGLGTILLTPVAVVSLGAARDHTPDRIFGAAAAAGLVAAIMSASAYDALSGPTSSWALWLLAALGIVAAEKVAGPRPISPGGRLSAFRLCVPVVGVVIGLIWAASVSPRSVVMSDFVTTNPEAPGTIAGPGQIAVNTVCETARLQLHDQPVRVLCRHGPERGTTTGYLEIAAADPRTVDSALKTFDEIAVRIVSPYRRVVIGTSRARSMPARTAPLWLGLVGGILVLLLPAIPVSDLNRTWELLAGSTAHQTREDVRPAG